LREPFRLLRQWSGSSVRGFGAGASFLPPPRSATPASNHAEPRPIEDVPLDDGATQGLGASAVPVTKRVNKASKAAPSTVLIGIGLVSAIGAASVALLRDHGSAAERIGASGSSAASASLSSTPPAQPSAVPSAVSLLPLPSPSASAASREAVAAKPRAPAHEKKAMPEPATPAAPTSVTPPKRQVLPGGVDPSIPF
jgi:hypothetical protein